ncbi:hypothetical protein ACFPOU_04415 [Massilia jejuensis]|uniref:Uncharacterized protein n=1 Tax=Massilia jejuensis TaxID=648894 RepID=A0ABW0PE95_9BURK
MRLRDTNFPTSVGLPDGSNEKIGKPVGLGDGWILVAIYQYIENSINIKEIPKLETFIDRAEFFTGNAPYQSAWWISKNAREVPLTGGIYPVGMGDRSPENTVGMGDG